MQMPSHDISFFTPVLVFLQVFTTIEYAILVSLRTQNVLLHQTHSFLNPRHFRALFYSTLLYSTLLYPNPPCPTLHTADKTNSSKDNDGRHSPNSSGKPAAGGMSSKGTGTGPEVGAGASLGGGSGRAGTPGSVATDVGSGRGAPGTPGTPSSGRGGAGEVAAGPTGMISPSPDSSRKVWGGRMTHHGHSRGAWDLSILLNIYR